jgi:hypothetical protein
MKQWHGLMTGSSLTSTEFERRMSANHRLLLNSIFQSKSKRLRASGAEEEVVSDIATDSGDFD